MKKASVFFILIGVLMTFSGCHLKHDMQPATCTEPSTCSVCGKTEGEPLGHIEVPDEAVEPTCTEPGLTAGSHCEVCGEAIVPQETIEALGHTEVPDEAVEPTCTEPGLTAGSHCEVCGEVIVPQETIEALGHDWEEATFSEPRICRVCGAEEGEALGTDLFINALNKPLQEEETADASEEVEKSTSVDEDSSVETAGEENAFHKKIQISGHSLGLEEVDEYLNTSSVSMITDIDDEQYKILAELVIKDSKPFKVLVAGDEEGVGITLPGIVEEYYYASYETLAEMMESLQDSSMPANAGTNPFMSIGEEELRDLLVKYEKILFSVVTLHNTKETRMEYPLPNLGKKQKCWVLEIKPDQGDWRTMLRKLLTTISEDEDLIETIIAPMAQQMYYNDPSAQYYYDSPEDYAEDYLKSFQDGIDSALEDVDSVAETLAELSFTVAYGNHRVYAVSVQDEYDMGLFYESYGDPETDREDVLVVKTDEGEQRLAYNKVRIVDGRVTGRTDILEGVLDDKDRILSYVTDKDEDDRLTFDIRYSSPEFTFNIAKENDENSTEVNAVFDAKSIEASVDVGVSDTDESISVPEQKKILKTEEDFTAAGDAISEKIVKAELYGHAWVEASCTEPRTCAICGETEGEPLGHDWKDADCTEPRTCRRCGETEGEALGHDWGDPDASGMRTCRRCGETEKEGDNGNGETGGSGLKFVEADDGIYRNDSIGLTLNLGDDWIYFDREMMTLVYPGEFEGADWDNLDEMLNENGLVHVMIANAKDYSENIGVQVMDIRDMTETERRNFLDAVCAYESDIVKTGEKEEIISGKHMRTLWATGGDEGESVFYQQEFVYFIHDYAVDVNMVVNADDDTALQKLIESIQLSDEVKETAA